MRLLAHKSDPILVFEFTNHEIKTNHLRLVDFLRFAQMDFLSLHAQGIVGINSGNRNGGGMVLQIMFVDIPSMKAWVAERITYSMEQFVQICRDLGKNPQNYISNATHAGGQGFTIQF